MVNYLKGNNDRLKLDCMSVEVKWDMHYMYTFHAHHTDCVIHESGLGDPVGGILSGAALYYMYVLSTYLYYAHTVIIGRNIRSDP